MCVFVCVCVCVLHKTSYLCAVMNGDTIQCLYIEMRVSKQGRTPSLVCTRQHRNSADAKSFIFIINICLTLVSAASNDSITTTGNVISS